MRNNSRTIESVCPRMARNVMPRDFLGLLLFIFVVGSGLLFGAGQLVALGFMLTGSYSLYFLKRKEPIPTEVVIYFVWIFWSLTGFMVSKDRELFISSMALMTQLFLMTFAIAGITMQRGSLGTNFLALIIGGVVMVALSYVNGEFVTGTGTDDRARIHGIMTNPNNYARVLLIATIGALYFMRGHFSWVKRIGALSVMVVLSLGIVYSASRQAFAGLFALIFLWVWFCHGKEIFRKKSHVITLVLIAIALGFLTQYMLSSTYMGYRFKHDFIENPVTQRHEEHKRLTYYREGWEVFKRHPLFGIGLGNFQAISKYSEYSHSDYIEVATSTGTVGLIMYYSIYVMLWRRLRMLRTIVKDEFISYNIGLLKASIVVMLLLAFTKPNLYLQNTWILMGSAIGYAWHLQLSINCERKRPRGMAVTEERTWNT